MHKTSHKIISEFNNKVNSMFMGLSFKAETHEYFVDDRKVPKSVSGVVHGFVKPTDFDAIAKAIDRRDKLAPGTTKALWAAETERACADGSDVHDYGENRGKEGYLPDVAKKQAIDKFWYDLERQWPGRYIIVGKEVRMYHLKYFFSGTDDITLYDRLTDKLIIADYKTNKDLFKNHDGNLLLHPFHNLLDSPYNHYQIQLSAYQLLLEQLWYEVSERWLIWLLPNAEYKVFKTHDFSSILVEYLEEKYHAQQSSHTKSTISIL